MEVNHTLFTIKQQLNTLGDVPTHHPCLNQITYPYLGITTCTLFTTAENNTRLNLKLNNMTYIHIPKYWISSLILNPYTINILPTRQLKYQKTMLKVVNTMNSGSKWLLSQKHPVSKELTTALTSINIYYDIYITMHYYYSVIKRYLKKIHFC